MLIYIYFFAFRLPRRQWPWNARSCPFPIQTRDPPYSHPCPSLEMPSIMRGVLHMPPKNWS